MKQLRGLTLSRINEITTRINSEENLHSLLSVIMESARELLDTEGASLLLYDSVSGDLIFDVVRGARGEILEAKRIPAGQGIAGICASDRKPMVVNDAQNDDKVLKTFDRQIGFVTRNLLAVPLMARGELIGVLEVVNTRDNRDFAGQDVSLMGYISNMAAIAIHNRQLLKNMSNRVEELNCIYDISEKIRLQDSFEGILDDTLETIERVLQVERLSVLLRDETRGHLSLERTRGFTLEEIDERIDPERGISGRVMESGIPLLVRDIERDLVGIQPVPNRYRTRSFISVPILREGRAIGILNAADKKNGEPFDHFELKVLSTVASQLADSYSRIQARQREQEIRNYRRDLETAAQIQRNSLPTIPSTVAGIEIATRYDACRDVGGDFYDMIYHSEDRISLLIADVAGKGVPAALFMEYSKTLLSGEIPRNLDPVTTLKRVNREIFRNSKMGLFVTVMLVQLEREFGRFRFATAGHNHQFLIRQKRGEVENLSSRGAPLGAFEDCEYLEKVVQYDPGDFLVFYTDGITEARNGSAGEEFGEERLLEILGKYEGRDAKELLEKVFRSVEEFRGSAEPFDDATMLVARL